MKNFNEVKESLRELGIKQGFDLYDKATTEKLNSENIFDVQWFSDYSPDWDDTLNSDINSFFKYMEEYQNAMNNNDIKSACSAIIEAMLYIGVIKNFFEYLESDMIRLIKGESKTTDFQWPQFNE